MQLLNTEIIVNIAIFHLLELVGSRLKLPKINTQLKSFRIFSYAI